MWFLSERLNKAKRSLKKLTGKSVNMKNKGDTYG